MNDFNLVRDVATEKFVGENLRFCERRDAKPMSYDEAAALAHRKYGSHWVTYAQIVPATYFELCSWRSRQGIKRMSKEKRVARAKIASAAASAVRPRKWYMKAVKLRVVHRPKEFIRDKDRKYKVAVCATGIRTAAAIAKKITPHASYRKLLAWSNKKPMSSLPDQDGAYIYLNETWTKVL